MGITSFFFKNNLDTCLCAGN